MGRVAAGIAATLILGFAGPAAAQTIGDEIQNEEQPGSEIQINLGGGGVQVERENGLSLSTLYGAGASLSRRPAGGNDTHERFRLPCRAARCGQQPTETAGRSRCANRG
jgi:hypothetical protein